MEILPWLNAAGFTLVAVLALRRLAHSPQASRRWTAGMFVPLALVAVASALWPPVELAQWDTVPRTIMERATFAVLLVYPVAAFHFAAHISRRAGGTRWVDATYLGWLVALIAAPAQPAASPVPWWVPVLALVVVLWFVGVAGWAATRILRSARLRPPLSRNRLWLLGVAMLVLSVATGISLLQPPDLMSTVVFDVVQVLGLVAAALFGLAVAPPAPLLMLWREPQLADIRRQTPQLLAMTTADEVMARVVPQAAALTGSAGSAFLSADGSPLFCHQVTAAQLSDDQFMTGSSTVEVPGGHGLLVTWPEPDLWVSAEGKPDQLLVGLASLMGLALSGLVWVSELEEELQLRRTTEQVLTEQSQQLARVNREVEEFLAVASHDLATPVRNITDYVDFLRHDLPADLTPEIREDLAFIEQGAQRLEALVSGLVTFTRSQPHGMNIQRLDLADVVGEAIADRRRQLIQVQAVVERIGLGEVDADRAQLLQLLGNLIDNCIKYRHPQRTLRIEIGADRAGGATSLWVADNGIGIPEADRDSVFMMFNRLNPAAPVAGTGIGLAVCKRIVEGHGGTIAARGVPNGGTEFRMVLPVRDHVGSGA